ncbi:MAG TPA: hypothetical protein VHM70_23815 [Polyangiaceae bacterium]|jgi:multidrug efflux pump subunit AcrA (membrane-fusion protein)|nr:hypothetical protein [Polyangiaceae bacterium]
MKIYKYLGIVGALFVPAIVVAQSIHFTAGDQLSAQKLESIVALADSALAAAQAAQTAADAAKTTADAAKTSADAAKTSADSAKTAADDATVSAGAGTGHGNCQVVVNTGCDATSCVATCPSENVVMGGGCRMNAGAPLGESLRALVVAIGHRRRTSPMS